MLANIQFTNWISIQTPYLIQMSFSSILSSPEVKRIKEFVVGIFYKLSDIVPSDPQSNELNLKPIAMISCLSLIALLVIAMVRNNNELIITPPKHPKPLDEPDLV